MPLLLPYVSQNRKLIISVEKKKNKKIQVPSLDFSSRITYMISLVSGC